MWQTVSARSELSLSSLYLFVARVDCADDSQWFRHPRHRSCAENQSDHRTQTTVLKVLRECAEQTPEPTLPMYIQDLEIDEQWSFVQRKKQQNWLWYALDRHSGMIIAFVLGRRTDASCKKLVQKLAPCQVQNFYTDHWKSYPKYLDKKRHHIGKDGTQNIERKNLNFRTHLKRLQRRTICFSKSKPVHYNILKIYIHDLNSKQHHF